MMGMSNGLLQKLRNLNAVYGLTYSPGYIASDGGVGPASVSNKEVFADYMPNPFRTNDRIIAVVEYVGNTTGATTGGWIGIGMYDADKTFRTRLVMSASLNIQIGDNGYTLFAATPVNYNDGLCRISFRSFGEANIYILPMTRLLTEAFTPYGISGHISA